MQGNIAIDTAYVDSLATNPYFLQAYQSPNYYAQVPQMTNTQLQKDTVTTPTVNPKDVNLNGTSEQIEQKKEKKNSKAGWLLAAVGTILLAIGAKKCHNIGVGNNIGQKVLDGAKKFFGEYGQKISNLWRSLRT